MNAEEIRKEKRRFENELAAGIRKFADETGAYITQVRVDTVPHRVMGGRVEYVVSCIDVKVEI